MKFVVSTLLVAAQLAFAYPAWAQSAAPVEIVLFSDFHCPFCARFALPFREIHSKGVDGVPVAVTFKHYPLPMHPRAPLAHQAAEAAGAQGKFWEMHDLLFANPQRVQREDFIDYAKTLQLDVDRFVADLDSDRVKARIQADLAEGQQLRVTGTPSFFINGKGYSGAMTLPQLTSLIGSEQRRALALAEISDAMLSKGPADAPVTLELFADLQSPVSPQAVRVVDDLMKRYPSAVRLQFRNFPLAFHPQAGLAHEAAMTAARDGRFWEFATYVLEHQNTVREQDLIALAGRLGLDQTRFAATLQQRRYAPRVEADVRAGTRRGIRGSPAIVLNGKRIDGVPNLQTLIDDVEAAIVAAETKRREKPKS